ncbi:MAG: DinB family protein [Capsulimonas sp.]|uniref:DinB family protein n=1 Tax=Capsulimonas sp. TaxID=2494211 RepID=UPI003265C28E
MTKEYESYFETLERLRMDLLYTVSALPPDALMRSPDGDAWSVQQHVHHLLLSDEEVIRQATRPSQSRKPRSPKSLWTVALVCRAPHVFPNIPVPEDLVDPSEAGRLALDEMTARWDATRALLRHHLKHLTPYSRGLTMYHHPMTGRLDTIQTLRLMEAHTTHHFRKIQELAGN